MSSTVRKSFVLLSCTFLGLICGTLYLYSSYSPQLAARLGYSVTDSSFIALIGTLGVSISGPIAGVLVDLKGYTISLLIGGTSIIMGYLLLKLQFDHQYSSLGLSCCLLFAIGSGSTFINLACLKCCAVSFPSIRGVATSLPLALYGLSALFYSVIASVFYPGLTSLFLGFLSMSSFAIFSICAPSVMLCDKEHPVRTHIPSTSNIEMASLGAPPRTASPALRPVSSQTKDVSGPDLFKSLKFWMLIVITGSLAGLGQMYIYSVGYMVKALVTNKVVDNVEAMSTEIDAAIQKNQQLQVGLLSIANCVGRIVSGISGDIITQSFHKKRSWLLFVPGIGMFMCQLVAGKVNNYNNLSLVSILIGFFYGFTFCIMPIIVGDIFGMENFSANWGLVGLAPIAPSFFFTSVFGRIYDSNSVVKESGASSCLLGNQCYNLIFSLATTVALIALVAITLLNFVDRLKDRKAHELK